jgi:hypothetical protein
MEEFEIYEVGSTPVIFWGARGQKGALAFRQDTGWEFHPSESIPWDSYHQEVYRNFKGDRLTEADLKDRDIPMPSFEDYDKQPRILAWSDNFRSEMPYAEVPKHVLRELRGHKGEPVEVYLVLEEDFYETCFGDGKFLYPLAALWAKTAAEEEMKRLIEEERDPAARKWDRYSIKEAELSADDSKKTVTARLNIRLFEHYTIEDIMRLLKKKRDR